MAGTIKKIKNNFRMSKPHIEWLTKSFQMYDAFCGDTKIHLKGGRLYELQVISILKKKGFHVDVNKKFIKKKGFLEYLFQNHKKIINANICVIDPYVLSLGKFNSNKTNIAIIHHINLIDKNVFRRALYFNLIRNLKKMDAVITVSKYWESYLNSKGITKTKTIYNSFDIGKYSFNSDEIRKFKYGLNLDKSKPIIYLGQNSLGKGIEKVLRHIRASKYNLIVTGKKSYPDENVKTFYFTDKEFPLFLASCDLVISMSTMLEGWNRIAHEALLVKTPVIGSGAGGMKELLQKSGQTVLFDLDKLETEIANSIKYKKELGEKGFEYVNQFDLKYFGWQWSNILKQLL